MANIVTGIIGSIHLIFGQRRYFGVLEMHGGGRGATRCRNRLRFGLELGTYQKTDRFLMDALHQSLEHFERFALVFLLWILLGITAQMNTLAQIVHRR